MFTLTLAAPPGLVLEVGEPEAIGAGWQERALAAPGLAIRGRGTLETAAGWPVTLVRSDAADGERVHAFFELDEWGLVVAIRGPGLDARRDELIALLREARPEVRTPVIALAQLWADVVEPAP